VDLRMPPELGGHGGGTNPEELFALGYAACYQSALALVARREKVDTSGSTVHAEVSVGPVPGVSWGSRWCWTCACPGWTPM
jgi:lipoyl-dependent peroxiredoxin